MFDPPCYCASSALYGDMAVIKKPKSEVLVNLKSRYLYMVATGQKLELLGNDLNTIGF